MGGNYDRDVFEINRLFPETWIGFNADDVVVKIRKFTSSGAKFERSIEIYGVTDLEVKKWDKYHSWQQVR